MICANQVPDHATIARFRVRHEEALAGLFGQVLGLCAEAGLVRAGLIAVDGSKFAAAASDSAIRTYEEIAAELLAEAARIDAAEDERYGAARGDELPEPLSTRGGGGPGCGRPSGASRPSEPPGRSRFRRTAKSGLRSAGAAWSRTGRPSSEANRDYEAYRARGVMKDGAPLRPPATALRAARSSPRARSTPPTPTPAG